MRQFSKPSGLDRLSLEARIVYTGFALFLFIAYATSAWLYLDDGLGVSGASAQRYYLGAKTAHGADTNTADRAPGEAAGPELELPDLPATATEMHFEKAPRQVMETFHFHLFSVPVCLLIIAHLFMMTSLSTRTKAWVIAFSTLATLAHIVLPPLIRFVSSSLAPLMFPSALCMMIGWLAMTLLPVIEMWRLPSRSARSVE